MKIKWFGHACFLITAKDGLRILTDPYDNSIGYKLGEVEADIVISSHDHFDHNYFARVSKSPQIVKNKGTTTVRNINFTGIPTFHDNRSGKDRGNNLIFAFEVDGVNICHLGDLGHILTPEQVKAIGQIDVLLLPVGGTFTIDANEGTSVMQRIKPKITIPMHYKTAHLTFSIDKIDKFLVGKTNVKKISEYEIEINKENLPAKEEIIVLNYAEK